MPETTGHRIKEKNLFKIGKLNVDNFKGTVMVDMMDVNYNRIYLHIHSNGEMMLEVFYLSDRLHGNTETPTSEIRNAIDIVNQVKENLGVQLIYTAELEGRKL